MVKIILIGAIPGLSQDTAIGGEVTDGIPDGIPPFLLL